MALSLSAEAELGSPLVLNLELYTQSIRDKMGMLMVFLVTKVIGVAGMNCSFGSEIAGTRTHWED